MAFGMVGRTQVAVAGAVGIRKDGRDSLAGRAALGRDSPEDLDFLEARDSLADQVFQATQAVLGLDGLVGNFQCPGVNSAWF